MSATTAVNTIFGVALPYLTDPTFLMTLIIAGSIALSVMGKLPWKTTGVILLIGALYAKLAEMYGPQVATTIIVSNVISYVVGSLVQSLKQKVIYQPMKSAFEED